MKKLFCALLLLFALTLPVFAVGEEIFIHPESHWLMMEGDNGLQVLADEYVLDFHWEDQGDTVYYTALEEGEILLRAIQIGDREGRTVPLELEEEQLSLLSTPSQSTEKMVDAAMTIIYRNEGSDGSINKDDNGAVSIGKVQWHGNRALNLLKSIVREAPDLSQELLGEALYDEIVTADSWGSRTVNEEEALAISALLKTDVGKAAQDALAATDITSYVNHALNLGLRSSTAIVYFSDLEKQWGYTGAKKQAQKAMEAAGTYEDVTLDVLHQACLNYTTKYHTRRNNVYNYCLSLGWEEFAVLTPQKPTAQVAGATVRLSWEPVEQAESYECFIKTLQNGFVDVCSAETEDTFCTFTLEADQNYYAYVVAKSKYSTSDSSLWAMFDTCLPVASTTVAPVAPPEGETPTQPIYQIECHLQNGRETHQIFAAGYKEGRLVTLGMAVWNVEANRFTLEGDLDEIRLLVMDGAFSWMPLCEVQTFDCRSEEIPPEEEPVPETPVPETPAPEETPAE